MTKYVYPKDEVDRSTRTRIKECNRNLKNATGHSRLPSGLVS